MTATGLAALAGAGSALAASAGLVTAPSIAPVAPPPAPPPALRLQLAPPILLPADGSYVTNDLPTFLLDRRQGQVRLRFLGSDEVFYLSSEPASLGGRVLKYDTGDVALTVAGWGGVTLFTEEAPSGIPAERQADALGLDPAPLPPTAIKPFADGLARDLAERGAFNVGFAADWNALARQAETARALAVDAMRNAAYALEQMMDESERDAIAGTLHTIRVAPAAEPGVVIEKDVLLVTYAPDGGPSARPSSLAIARTLEEGF